MKTASICAGVIGYSYALKFAMGGNEVWAQNRTEKSSELAKERVRESLHSLVVNGVYSEEQEKENDPLDSVEDFRIASGFFVVGHAATSPFLPTMTWVTPTMAQTRNRITASAWPRP